MQLYDEQGYLDIDKIVKLDLPFNFIVGGRGTGKTFGALKYVIDNKIKFMLMRRMQSQLDLINKADFSPFKALNNQMGYDIYPNAITKYNVGFYHSYLDESKKIKVTGSPVGYSVALSTISNLRGFDASDVELLIFDEFIPEKHERPIKEEGSAFFNAYETLNRNREITGQKPIQVLALANANDLGNPLFMELGLIKIAEKMRRKNIDTFIDRNRGIGIFMLVDSPISEAKKKTVLYKITEGTDFADMAIDNAFNDIDDVNIKSMPLKEYKPVVGIGEITIYKHKSNNTYYCTTHRTGTPKVFSTSDLERKRFWIAYGYIWDKYMKNKIIFEDSTAEVLFNKYLV